MDKQKVLPEQGGGRGFEVRPDDPLFERRLFELVQEFGLERTFDLLDDFLGFSFADDVAAGGADGTGKRLDVVLRFRIDFDGLAAALRAADGV